MPRTVACFETLDPSSGRAIAQVAHAGAEDVEAVRAAREAFEDGRWSSVFAARTRAMLALAEASTPTSWPRSSRSTTASCGRFLARRVDVALAAEHLRYFAGWPTRITGELLPVAQRDMHCYTRKEPVGGLRADHPVELPAADVRVEAGLRARRGLHGGPQAGRADPAQRPAARRRRSRRLPEGVFNVITGDGETGAAS